MCLGGSHRIDTNGLPLRDMEPGLHLRGMMGVEWSVGSAVAVTSPVSRAIKGSILQPSWL